MENLSLDAVYVILSLLGIFPLATGVVDLFIRKEYERGIFPTRIMSWIHILGGAAVSVSGVFRLVQMGIQ